jgi:hypothetical protein
VVRSAIDQFRTCGAFVDAEAVPGTNREALPVRAPRQYASNNPSRSDGRAIGTTLIADGDLSTPLAYADGWMETCGTTMAGMPFYVVAVGTGGTAKRIAGKPPAGHRRQGVEGYGPV